MALLKALLTFPLLFTLTSSALLAGCTDCAPETVPAEVTLGLQDEEVRTLPLLTSGETRIAGIDLPDSHGRLEFQVDVSHGLPSIDIEDLRLAVEVAGQDMPIKVHAVDGGHGWSSADDGRTWDGGASDGTRLTLWWAVDRDQVSTVSELMLEEGAAYEATVSFAWSFESCTQVAHGDVEQAFADFVQASVNAKTFEADGAPDLEITATGVGFRADYSIGSGLDVILDDAEALAVYFGSGTTGGLGVVAFTNVGWLVDGAESNQVTPGDSLRVHSAASALARGSYSASGTMAPAGLAAGPGLYVLVVTLDYTAEDPTVGAETDLFAYGIVRS